MWLMECTHVMHVVLRSKPQALSIFWMRNFKLYRRLLHMALHMRAAWKNGEKLEVSRIRTRPELGPFTFPCM